MTTPCPMVQIGATGGSGIRMGMGTPDEFGNRWEWTSYAGFMDSPKPTVSTIPLTSGSLVTAQAVTSRSITLEGYVDCTQGGDYFQAEQTLALNTDPTYSGGLTAVVAFLDDALAGTAYIFPVYLADAVQKTRLGTLGLSGFTFHIPLVSYQIAPTVETGGGS